MARATSRSISGFCMRATMDMTRGTTLAARKPKGMRMSAAFPKATPRATSRPRSSSPSTGMRMVSTTTARSSTRVRPIIAPVRRVKLAAIAQESGQHHGAGHGDHHADDGALQGGPAQGGAYEQTEADGQEDAEGRSEEGDPFDLEERARRELHAHGIHEEDDADFRDDLEGVDVGDGRARREGAAEKATEDIAENEWLARGPREGAAEDGGDEDVGEIAEDEGFGGHLGRIITRTSPIRPGCTERKFLIPSPA